MTLKGGIMVVSVHTTVTFQAFNGLEHGMTWFLRAWEGLLVPGTERHACLFEVRTRTYVCMRQL